ncbi:cell division protein FtsK [Streptomyces agglomeratus]|uniref:FtsK/SpoIIIE domain-containing protein n=2 Tax=Streptomyces agglomeratus TaxID=285458 RepID=UPI000854F752|nr:FtsK/SpoIIIE domain-containing protein [Streptomyces agglomeratus]OEJ39295.1 cell division protein FtsK [Streptomyces agglomeratus]OEJ46322.1 cell division protein FtsK [Streptomyces agglomeratus]
MQIRLTVLAPRAHSTRGTEAPEGRVCDVLVTAPAGTALAAVASGLAAAVSGPGSPPETTGAVVVYAGRERLDAQRCALGEPPLVDGAVLSLHAPAPEPENAPDSPARLHVTAGPDAGGVHLLHHGQIRVGRSAEADVPLDDPDVSRLHCAVTLTQDGQVTVADLGSTNGTSLDGEDLTEHPVPLPPGALLRVGESALRLLTGHRPAPLPTTPDGEGHLRLSGSTEPRPAPVQHQPTPPTYTDRRQTPAGRRVSAHPSQPVAPSPGARPAMPGGDGPGSSPRGAGHNEPEETTPQDVRHPGGRPDAAPAPEPSPSPGGATAAPAPEPPPNRRGGIGAWARRLAGGRPGPVDEYAPAEATPLGMPPACAGTAPGAATTPLPDAWPDPAALLLTALGPGPRLWERDPSHPEALVLRLGTADRPAPDGGRPLPAVPVTVSLREVGSLGLAGPRARLAGLARSVVAQLSALHSPTDLEIVLIATDRARPPRDRTAEWAWLGWLPHLRPARGQDCRLLLAYDRDQATARLAELLRRTEEGHAPEGHTVVIVDGDPGSAALRESTARLAATGAAHGIHLVCLAETPAASPLSPVAATYEAACTASPAFRECGAAGLLSGDVATALRLLRTAGGEPAGHGTLAAVDAVSAPWAERFARALAPLRPDGHAAGTPDRATRPSRATALPPSSRLLDELGLARATPASLMARWAAAADDGQAPGATRAWAVLGAGPRGPLCVDLTAEGPHLLIEGPAGSGRTELLRSVAASLAAAARPDRLGLVLVDGAGGERGEGLRACTELPHVSTRLVASDPVRMREFAQALGAELKRRHELLGSLGFAEWHTRREVSGRMIGQRAPSAAEQNGDLDSAPSGTLRLRTTTSRERQARADTEPSPLPRLVVLVDDLDALVAPALGSTGRPAAGSVVRALEAVAREGERLGVHLVATSARPDRTADTELARGARLRVVLDPPPPAPSPDEPAPGRGRLLRHHSGDAAESPAATPFQSGRVTGRIPRTATLRPTVVPLEWERMGDPPTRRPVRELGNGPTDLALLASALDRAARTVNATPLPPLGAPHEG